MPFLKRPKSIRLKRNLPVSKAVKRFVKKEVKRAPERKYTLVNYGGVQLNRATANVCSFFTCLTDTIPQGLQDNNARVGDEISLTELKINFYAQMTKGVTAPDDVVIFRLVVFQWNDVLDTTGATGAALGAILPSGSIFLTGVAGATNNDPSCHYNHDRIHAKQLSILYDKMWRQESNSNTVGGTFTPDQIGGMMREHRVSLLRARKRLHFVNNSTTNASGHIFVIVLTNNPVAGTNPLGYLSTKLDFNDS